MIIYMIKKIAATRGIKRSRILILALILFLVPFCGPDPSIELLESYSFSFKNDQNQRLNPGESINVVLKIFDNKEPVAAPFKIIFDVIEGGGSVSTETILSENSDSVTTTWTLGPNSLDHRLRALVYKPNGDYLTSTDLTAITLRENEWNAVSTDPDGNITGMVADTVAGVTLMVTNGKVY
ncbi:MAG TPA: hypothetical protein DCZ51_08275, partial [Bacteroidales bacterium]|nr:hypothetical protein [Bacteroidales bacterium]